MSNRTDYVHSDKLRFYGRYSKLWTPVTTSNPTGGPDAALNAIEEVPQGDQAGDFLLMKGRLLDAAGRVEEARKFLTDYPMTTRTSPAATVAPTWADNFTTCPAFGDFISFCIFIASTTTSP